MCAMLAMINRNMSAYSLLEDLVPTYIHPVISHGILHIYFGRKSSRSAWILKNASAPQETACQISCINYKTKKYLGNYFSAVKYAFEKLRL